MNPKYSIPQLFYDKMERENNIQNVNDFDLLMIKICNELKKRDKTKNGLILYHSFIEVMDLLQIEYGTRTMDYLMKNCFVTEDGFVNYKKLLLLHDPNRNNRNNSDYVSESMNPKSVYLQDAYEECEDCLKAKNEIIRKLYSQWDKCLLQDMEFVNKLKTANVNITPEFLRVLALYGPSRSLKFGEVMKALYINTNDRKCRTNVLSNSKDYSSSVFFDENAKCFQEPHRNPITWNDSSNIEVNILFDDVDIISRYLSHNSNNEKEKKEILSKEFIDTTINKIIKLYIGNNLNEKTLRTFLQKLNITISTELINLIKQHESDNNGKFKDFVTAIYRCMSKEMQMILQRNLDGNNGRAYNSNSFYNGSTEAFNDINKCYDKYADKYHDTKFSNNTISSTIH